MKERAGLGRNGDIAAADRHCRRGHPAPLELPQQQFLPALGAVDVAGAQLGGEAVTLAIEQQQRIPSKGVERSDLGDSRHLEQIRRAVRDLVTGFQARPTNPKIRGGESIAKSSLLVQSDAEITGR